jgi:hypothetical protein
MARYQTEGKSRLEMAMTIETFTRFGLVGFAIVAMNFMSPLAFSKTASYRPDKPAENSQQVIDHLNSLRAHLSGINGRPLPDGSAVKQSNGNVTIKDGDGHRYDVRANGTLASFLGDGEKINFNDKGKITLVHTGRVDVRQEGGERVVVAQDPHFTSVVAVGEHNGYVERTFVRDKQNFVERTVIVKNPMSPFMSSVHAVTYTYTRDGTRRLLSTGVADPLSTADAVTALHGANERADALERNANRTILDEEDAFENR